MKTFNDFLIESTGDQFKKKFGSYNDIDVFVSGHSVQRWQERLPDADDKYLATAFEKITAWIKSNHAKMGQVGDGEMMFRIKSQGSQSYLVSYRRASHQQSVKKKNLYIVTMYEKGRDKPKTGTKLQLLEQHKDIMIIDID